MPCSGTSPATPTARSIVSSAIVTSSGRSSSRRPRQGVPPGCVPAGAYQETLGDLHNLFGDTHVVHIRLHDEGGWWIEEIVKGDTAGKVLSYMQYESTGYSRNSPATASGGEGRMTLAESQALRRFYEWELNGYTYLE